MSIYKGNNLISGHQVLYSMTGQNTDGAMTQKAVSDITENTRFDGQWISNYQTLAEDVAIATIEKTYSLDNYLPKDGYNYEVLISVYLKTGATSGNYINFYIGSDIFSRVNVATARTRTNSNMASMASAILPVGRDRTLRVFPNEASANGTYNLRICGYRRIGTNA